MSEEFEILSRKIDALTEIVAEITPMARERAKQLTAAPTEKRATAESLVQQILLDIGAPDHLLGHPFVVEAVVLCVNDGCYINCIMSKLYPQVAARFNTNASRVERAIRNLVEIAWDRGDIDVLYSYFGNTISRDRGKPTNGEFIARIANVVRQQLGA